MTPNTQHMPEGMGNADGRVAKPRCSVCDYWDEGDACAHHACPGRRQHDLRRSNHRTVAAHSVFCGALNKGANADALSEQYQRLREREAERALGIGGGAFTFQHDRSDTDA